MRALVVCQSHWGNTGAVAAAVATALDAAPAIPVADAPKTLPPDLELLVVGAPTHAMSLPTERSSAEARSDGGADAAGLREWLLAVTAPPVVRFATFGTTQGTSRWVGSSARAAAKVGRKRGFALVGIADFAVLGRSGPLADGELDRAADWARGLPR